MSLEVSDREFATILALFALAQLPDSDLLNNHAEFFTEHKPLTDPQIARLARRLKRASKRKI